MRSQKSKVKSQKWPDKHGHFGIYGGRYISETLMPGVLELEKAYLKFKNEPDFKTELDYYLKEYVGRPTPLYFAEMLTKKTGGAKVYLKREITLFLKSFNLKSFAPLLKLSILLFFCWIIAETGA